MLCFYINPDRLCSWSKSVIISSSPLLFSPLCLHSLYHLPSLPDSLHQYCPLPCAISPPPTCFSASSLASTLFHNWLSSLFSLFFLFYGFISFFPFLSMVSCVFLAFTQPLLLLLCSLSSLQLCVVTMISDVPIIPL